MWPTRSESTQQIYSMIYDHNNSLLMAKVWAEKRMASFSCLVLGAQAIATPTLIQANGTWQQTKVENMSASSLYEELKISGTNEFIQVC